MKRSKFLTMLILGLILVTGVVGSHQQIAAQQATPAATAPAKFDLKADLQQFLAGLPADFDGITPVDALKAISSDPKPYIVDLRNTPEFATGGFIAGAVNIPLPTLTQSLDKLPAKDSLILVYCAIGHRGVMAMMTLRLLGYTNVKSIFGGFKNWTASKLPVAQGAPPAATVTGAKAPDYNPDLFAALDKFITGLPGDFYGVTPTAALQNLKASPKPVLLDVRESKELTSVGYIDGMSNIPLRTLLDDPAKLPSQMDAPIITYCAIGHRGGIAMMTLRLLGYTNVASIFGGFNNWVAASLPIVKPVPATEVATASS